MSADGFDKLVLAMGAGKMYQLFSRCQSRVAFCPIWANHCSFLSRMHSRNAIKSLHIFDLLLGFHRRFSIVCGISRALEGVCSFPTSQQQFIRGFVFKIMANAFKNRYACDRGTQIEDCHLASSSLHSTPCLKVAQRSGSFDSNFS